jgi:hypothetical protein
MEALLEKPHICRMFARNNVEIREVLQQIMLDITTEENRDTVGPTILALKHFHDIFALFEAKGRVILANEEREDRTAKKHAERRQTERP